MFFFGTRAFLCLAKYHDEFPQLSDDELMGFDRVVHRDCHYIVIRQCHLYHSINIMCLYGAANLFITLLLLIYTEVPAMMLIFRAFGPLVLVRSRACH